MKSELHQVLLDVMSQGIQRLLKSFITNIGIEFWKPCYKIPLILNNSNLVLLISSSSVIELKMIYFEEIITMWIIFIIQHCPVITVITTQNKPFPRDISKYIIIDSIFVELNDTR